MSFDVSVRPDLAARFRREGWWREETMSDVLRRNARQHGDREALCDGRYRLTHGQLAAAVERMAAYLSDLGIRRGDVVAIQLPNWVEFAVCFFAVNHLGAVATQYGPDYRAREVEFILGFSGARAVIVPDRFRDFDYPAMLAGMRERLPALREVIVVGHAVPEGCRSFREAVDLGDLRPSTGDEPLASRCPVGADDIMRMAFTSGTTGDPKAVVHTYNTTLCVPRIARSAHAYDENAVLLIFLPVGLNWGFLNLVEALYHGARAVLVDRFDAGRVLRLIQAERVTHFSTSPTALIALLNDPGLGACDLTSLRLIVSGGASCPVEVIRQVQERFPARFLELYGMLETGYHTFTRMEDDPVAVCGKVGRPADGMGLRILDDEGRDLPPGEVGEIACFGPSVTIGYNRNPEANARSFTPDGWFLTGDLGVVDESGNLQIVGRKKDMIIRGGANIYPRELEEILFTHPKVLNVAVVGLPDPYLGERTCACIIPKPGETLTLAEVVAFLEGRIARYKLPQHLEIFQDFPLTPTGKVRKFALRELVQHRLQAGQKGDDGSGQG